MFFILSVVSLVLLSVAGNYIFYRSQSKSIRNNRIFKTVWIFETVGLMLLPLFLITMVAFAGVSTDSRLFMWGVFTIFLFVIPLIVYMLYALIAILPFKNRFRSITTIIGLFLMGSIASMILYGGIVGRKKIVVEKQTLYSARLPIPFDGFRIVQLSDLHLGSLRHNPEYIRAIIDSVNRLNPDVVFFTGDLVNSKASEATPFLPLLSQLKAKYGVYSVMGNHDYAHYHKWQNEQERLNNVDQLMTLEREAGWNLLNNAHHIVYEGKDSIIIAGVENWGEKHFGQQGNLAKALQGISSQSFTLLLSHNPIHWQQEVLPTTDIDLTLSGHTHAMQFQIGNFSPSSWIYPEWSGIYKNGNQYLNVNRGTGFVIFPARIGAYPEISFIELRHKPA